MLRSPCTHGIVTILLAAAALVALGRDSARAAAAPAQEPSTAESRPIVSDDLVTAARTVRVNEEVDGDVAAAGAEVTVRGPVDGYVMSAGRTVTLEGQVGNDVWAAGQTVTIDSHIGNNAMVAGRTIHLSRESVVGGDASLAGNAVTAEGRVERNLSIGARTARIGAEVGGAVDARAERVSILPGARIHGDLYVTASRPPDIAPGAIVAGQVHYEKARIRATWMAWPLMWLAGFGALLLVGAAVVAFSPAWAGRVAATLRTRFARSFAIGFLVLVLVPVIMAALAITLIGIPLAALLLAIYVVLLVLSGAFVSYRVGEWTLDRVRRRGAQASRWAPIVVGALLVSFGMTLPFVGWVIAVAVILTGMGALVLERRDLGTHLRGEGRA